MQRLHFKNAVPKLKVQLMVAKYFLLKKIRNYQLFQGIIEKQ